MITLYGISNCTTVKKALHWLREQGQDFVFFDFKKQAVTPELIIAWLKTNSWEVLLNRKGTTWRLLTDEEKQSVVDEASALKLMLIKPSSIKRPVVDWGHGKITVGFDEAAWRHFKAS